MKKFIVAATLLILSSASFADELSVTVEITTNEGPQGRCSGIAVNPGECSKMRDEALQEGCITQKQYDSLIKHSSFPLCVFMFKRPTKTLMNWCACGCFAPETGILATDLGQRRSLLESLINIPLNQVNTPMVTASAKDIAENRYRFGLVHLGEGSSLSNMIKEVSNVRISTVGHDEQSLIQITTIDGRILRLTSLHPVLVFEGKMVSANKIKQTDMLVDESGSPVQIKSVETVPFNGSVYNFSSETGEFRPGKVVKERHVIFANKLAVGDLFWQGSLENEMNRTFLRN